MSNALFSRRWFLRASATAAVALVAARVVPVESLPLSGPVHQEIHDDVIKWLRAQWVQHVKAYGKPPKRIQVGRALFDNYEAALTANQRMTWDTAEGFSSLFFKGAPMEEVCTLAPWGIQMVPA